MVMVELETGTRTTVPRDKIEILGQYNPNSANIKPRQDNIPENIPEKKITEEVIPEENTPEESTPEENVPEDNIPEENNTTEDNTTEDNNTDEKPNG